MDERLPWRERFRQRAPLEEALMEAGVRHVRTETRKYRFAYSLDEYLEGPGDVGDRPLRALDARRAGVRRVPPAARAVFAERFADPVNDFREVLFGTGTKP